MTPKSKRSMAIIMTLLVIAVPLVVVALTIDDWSRDLSTNTAATAIDHSDERLRPVEIAATPDQVRSALDAFCQEESKWNLVEEKPLPDDSPVSAPATEPASTTYHLVRKTALIGFADDVWLVVQRLAEERVRLHAESRSRIGKGDLGQNPRNLRELLAGIEDRSS